jgi:hypothetical protein
MEMSGLVELSPLAPIEIRAQAGIQHSAAFDVFSGAPLARGFRGKTRILRQEPPA